MAPQQGSVLPLLRRLQLELWSDLLEEYELTDCTQLRRMGRAEVEAKMTELMVEPNHIKRICDEVWRDAGDASGSSGATFSAMDKAACLEFLDGLEDPVLVGVGAAIRRALGSDEQGEQGLDGATVLAALESTRELRELFGLRTVQARCAFERAVRRHASHLGGGGAASLRSGAAQWSTLGAIYSEAWLKAVAPLYSMHMGAENMAPMLYSLVRFVKPRRVVEIGAGYTSIFLLQALRDNYEELSAYSSARRRGPVRCGAAPWLVERYFEDAGVEPAMLHSIDNMAHDSTTAHLVLEVAQRLGLAGFLSLEVTDGFAFSDDLTADTAIDLLWVDFGAGERLDEFFQRYWPKVRAGGLVLVHSTLTNRMTRLWLESMRSRAEPLMDANGLAQYDAELGEFATLSLLEPFKMFQNSFTMFQKRDAFTEPVHSELP